MVHNLADSFKKALGLIQSGKPDAARPILLEILRDDEAIEQAWFLLSYTLPPGEEQEYALNQALRINPDFDRARKRLEKLQNKDDVEAVKETKPKRADPQKPVGERIERLEAPSAEQPDESVTNEEKEVGNSAFPTDTLIEGVDIELEKEKRESSIIFVENQIESGGIIIHIKKRPLVLMGLIVIVLVIWLLVSSPLGLSNLFASKQADATRTVVQGFRTLLPTWTP